jgi:hypothetical protein
MLQRLFQTVPRPDYVLWIDDDNVVTFTQFMQLLKDLERHPDIDGVAGYTCVSRDVNADDEAFLSVGHFYGASGLSTEAMTPQTLAAAVPFDGDGALVPIGYSGFPCFLMRFSALLKAGPKAFVPIVDADSTFGFVGEDIAFCRRALDGGALLCVDRRVKVPHLKLRALEPRDAVADPLAGEVEARAVTA